MKPFQFQKCCKLHCVVLITVHYFSYAKETTTIKENRTEREKENKNTHETQIMKWLVDNHCDIIIKKKILTTLFLLDIYIEFDTRQNMQKRV